MLQPEIEEPGAKVLDERSLTAGTEALAAGYRLIQAKDLTTLDYAVNADEDKPPTPRKDSLTHYT